MKSLNKWIGSAFILYAVVSPISLSGTNIVLGIIIILGFSLIYLGRGEKKVLPDSRLLALMVLLFSWSALSRVISGTPLDKDAFSNIWEYAPIVLIPLFLQITDIKKDGTIMALLASSSLVCLLGIIQYLFPTILYPFPKQLIRAEFKGFFSHHLHTGGFYSITAIIVFSLALFWQEKGRKRVLLWLFFLLNMAALLLSMARSYYISLSLILLIILFTKNLRWFATGSIAFALIVVVLVIFPNPVKERLRTLTDPNFRSNKERILMWKAALKMAKDHPLIGVGKGRWTQEATESYFPMIEKEYDYKIMATAHAHNTYLTVLAETGIIGLFFFLLFWLSVAWTLFTAASKVLRRSFEYALIIGTLGGLGNLFIAGMFENNFGTSVIVLLISFLIGLSLDLKPKSLQMEG